MFLSCLWIISWIMHRWFDFNLLSTVSTSSRGIPEWTAAMLKAVPFLFSGCVAHKVQMQAVRTLPIQGCKRHLDQERDTTRHCWVIYVVKSSNWCSKGFAAHVLAAANIQSPFRNFPRHEFCRLPSKSTKFPLLLSEKNHVQDSFFQYSNHL